MAFNHENLKVYQCTLLFNVKVGIWTGQWDGKHAICDHLSRAAGSMLEKALPGLACEKPLDVVDCAA